MKAVVLNEVHQPVSVEEMELDDVREDEVRVKMVASGVCHSDYSVMDGTILLETPVVLGHEGAGIIEEVGAQVTTVKPGDHVVLAYIPQCGRCYFCTVGQPNLCETTVMTRAGSLPNGHRPIRRDGVPLNQMTGIGTMSEYAVVHETSLVPIDADIPLDKAALVGCAVMTGVGAAINTAGVQPGASVAVFGTGGVGLNAIQGAAMAGANTVIAVDTNPLKLEFAQNFGATHTVNASDADPVIAIQEMTGGRGADYTFEAIGNPQVMRQAYDSARRGGTVTIIGMARPDSELVLPAPMIPRDEKKILGSYYGSTRQRVDMPRLLDLYRSGRLKLDELITETYPIDEAQQAFDDLAAGKNARGVLIF